MCRGIDARFPVAEAPVNRGARERGLALDQFPHALEVAMRDADDRTRQDPGLENVARERRGRGQATVPRPS